MGSYSYEMSRMKFGVSTLGYIQVLDADHGNDVDDLVQENHLQYHHHHHRTLMAIKYLVSLDSTSRLSNHEFELILTKEFEMTKLLNN